MLARQLIGAIVLLSLVAGTGGATVYEVREGDTLFLIARRELGDGTRWTEVAELNGIAEPWTIRVGQRIDLPSTPPPPTAPPATTAPEATAVTMPRRSAPAMDATREVDPVVAPPVEPSRASTTAEPLAFSIPEVATEPWTLDEALRRAAKRNITLRTQALSPRAAANDLEAARAGFDPTLTASVDRRWSRTQTANAPATRSENGTTTAGLSVSQSLPTGTSYTVSADHSRSRTVTPAASGAPTHIADVAVSVTQPLLEGAGRSAAHAGVDAAEAALEAARQATSRQGAVTRADVEAAYWTLAEAEEAERVARESLSRSQALLDRNLALLREGLLADVEVLTARNGVASRREAVIAAILDRRNRAEELLFLVEGDEATSRTALPTVATAVPDPATPPDAAMLEARSLRDRPDLAAAVAELRAAEIRLGSARNALLPNLDATASAGTGGRAGRFGTSWDGVTENDEPTWSVGATLTLPLGNRGDRARADAAAVSVERQRLAVAALRNEIRLGVRSAHRDVALGLARLEAAREARFLSTARWGAEQKRLEFGLGDTLRVLEAEQDAATAELTLARAKFAVTTAWARLRAAVPGLGDGAFSSSTEESP